MWGDTVLSIELLSTFSRELPLSRPILSGRSGSHARPYVPPTLRLLRSEIIAVVCEVFQISRDDFKRRERREEFYLPRWAFSYLARRHTPSSWPEIGREMERDHTTALYSARQMEAAIERGDPRAIDMLVACYARLLARREGRAA